MKKRNLLAVFFLPFVTFGIYNIVWAVKTKEEMNNLGANIPTAWLLIVPFVNFYWLYKYSEGVELVTGNKMSTVTAFIVEFLLGIIGNVILQSEFNKLTNAVQPLAGDVNDVIAPAPAHLSDEQYNNQQSPVALVQPIMAGSSTQNGQYQSSAPTVDTTTSLSLQPSPALLDEGDDQIPSTPNQF